VRSIGMDVHIEFCEVAVAEGGRIRSGPRILTTPEELEVFGQSLGLEDEVALENTGIASAVAEILRPHVARVVVANPQAVRAIAWSKVKTDRVDARTLAKLLATGFLPEVWTGDEWTRALRRQISRRAQLVRARTRAKNEVHAVLQRNLVGSPPATDLFGIKGRAWLTGQVLPADERRAIEACLRQINFFDSELRALEAEIARAGMESVGIRRLMTIPGVDLTTAATLVSAIGTIGRFPTPRHLVGYLGLDPRVRQSGSSPARHGSISKQGSSQARHVLVEAAWTGPPGRCGPSPSASGCDEVGTWPPWQWPASSPCCAGTCSTRARTTPSPVPPSPARSSAAWNCGPEPSNIQAAGA